MTVDTPAPIRAPRGAGLPADLAREATPRERSYPSDSPAVRAVALTLARNYSSMRVGRIDINGNPRPTDRAYLVAWRVVTAALPHLRHEILTEAADQLAALPDGTGGPSAEWLRTFARYSRPTTQADRDGETS